MGKFKQFLKEQETDSELIWEGNFNESIINVFGRDDTGAEEIYVYSDSGVLVAAVDLIAFTEAAMPEDFRAEFNPEDSDEIFIYIGDELYTSLYVEVDEDGLEWAVQDLQLEDDELDYLKVNGVLPEVKFGDEDFVDPADPEQDFWPE